MAAETQKPPSRIDGIPYFYQPDPRFADSPYSITHDPEQTLATSGCVPIKEAMIASYYEGVEISPLVIAKWNIEHGFRTPNAGTDSLRSVPALAEEYGYRLERPGLTYEEFYRVLGAKSLDRGLIFTIVRHPDRERTLGTPGGHAVLLRSMSEEGTLHVTTSTSVEKSLKGWTMDEVISIADPIRTFAIFPKSHTR